MKQDGTPPFNTCDLFLEDVRVPGTPICWAQWAMVSGSLWAAWIQGVSNAAVAVGIAQNVLEESVAYAKTREQFGKPIIETRRSDDAGRYADRYRGRAAAIWRNAPAGLRCQESQHGGLLCKDLLQ